MEENQKMNDSKGNSNFRIRINHQIRVPEVRVVYEDGSSKIVQTRDALYQAKNSNLDLVEVNPKSNPPVCKIMDYGKFKYQEKKKRSAEKKTQKIVEIKEIKIRQGTDTHDLEHKKSQAKQFLSEGNKVKFSLRFSGREITHSEIGKEKLKSIVDDLSSMILSNHLIKMEGKIMSVIVSPKAN